MMISCSPYASAHIMISWMQSVTSRLETSRYRDFFNFFESIGIGLDKFGLEKEGSVSVSKNFSPKKSQYRSRKFGSQKKSRHQSRKFGSQKSLSISLKRFGLREKP